MHRYLSAKKGACAPLCNYFYINLLMALQPMSQTAQNRIISTF